MARSHREIFHFVAVNMILYIGVVGGLNCDSRSIVGKSVPFCSHVKSTGRNVYLSGIDKDTDGLGCSCSISLSSSNQDPVTIEIKNITATPNLCDYSLYSVYRNTSTRLYGCDDTVHIQSFVMKPMEIVRLHMKLLGNNNNAGFPLCLRMSSDRVGSIIGLNCTSTSTTTTALQTTLRYMNTTSTKNSMSTIYKNRNTPTSNTRINSDRSAAHSTTQNSRPGGSDGRSTTKPQPPYDDSDRLTGIIIGSIVGVLVGVALFIVIICLVKRRNKEPPYEIPLEPQIRPHSHVNTTVTPNSNALRYNNQNTQVSNQGMIYLENDLYKSIDDDEPVGRRGGNHEGMIYLENDLYLSSNQTDNVHQDAENTVPHQPVEYAVVNKTAKKSSSGNGTSMGHTVGPHGDEYTIVLKK